MPETPVNRDARAGTDACATFDITRPRRVLRRDEIRTSQVDVR